MLFISGATTVTLNGCQPQTNLPNIEARQTRDVAEDGTVYVYDKTTREWFFELKLRVSNSQRSAVRSFFHTVVQYSKTAFSLTPDAGIDLGKGAGVQLTNVRLWQDGYSERPYPGGSRWEISLLLRTSSTGTGAPA